MNLSRYITIQKLKEDRYIMINALSGAIDVIDEKSMIIMEKIKTNKYIYRKEDDDFLEQLSKRGYLFESVEAEQAYIEKVYGLYSKVIDRKMAKIVICPTLSCNLRCVYCFESEEIKSSKKVMSVEEIDDIFSHIETILIQKKLQGYEIELFGGEPLLPVTYDANERIFELARERGKVVSIISNGTHIGYYEKLLRKYRDCIDNIQITIDGIKAIHDKRRIKIDKSGTFEVIVSGIDKLLEIGIKVGVRINLDRENIDYLKELVTYFEEKGWNESKYFHADVAPVVDHTCDQLSTDIMKENEIIKKIQHDFPCYSEKGYFKFNLFRVLNHINDVLNNKEDKISIPSFHYCEGNRMEFYVFSPDGYVYLCPEAVGSVEARIGEFGKELELYDTISHWENRNILTIEKCKTCEIAPFCGGGCPFASLKVNKDINIPVCDDSKEVLKDYIESIKDSILAEIGD